MDELTKARTIRLNPADNVVVARAAIAAGTPVEAGVITTDKVPAGHKIATHPIAAGEAVRKYDQIIGFATAAIAPGDHVHSHNLAMGDFARDYAFSRDARATDMVPEAERAVFQGYRRPDGRIGTRNYIGIVTTVNCSATVAKHIARACEQQGFVENTPGLDGIVPFVHNTGCGMAGDGEGFANLQRTLWGFATHPNFVGVLLVGLGCEVNQLPLLAATYDIKPGPQLQMLTIQGSGGTRETVAAALDKVRDMLPMVAAARREPVPASELVVALQCGGSDAYSGISANPALGYAADLVVAQGGTVILSETPEIYGAEHLLTRRAATEAVGRTLIERIHWWEDYVAKNGGSMDNNPSPGNKAGGLTTILEKSLGAAVKGGTTNLTAVYKYAERVRERGFVFMDSPGFDPCSITGQTASGANVVCFTTGRGSVSGFKPAPCLKIATNSTMYSRMSDDMDVNCGRIVDGEATVAEMGADIFEAILATASGAPTRSEALGFGEEEFIPWQIGAVM